MKYRVMQPGEIKQAGDQCKHNGRWHDIAGTVGKVVRPHERGMFRTTRDKPEFFARK